MILGYRAMYYSSKIAINEGLGYSAIYKDTQKPSGLLSELTYLVTSTSKQHKGEKTKITVIKEEAADWKPDD